MPSLLTRHWNRFTVAGAALAAQFAPLVHAPPGDDRLFQLGRFWLILIVAVWFVPIEAFKRREHTVAWWFTAVATAAAAVVIAVTYNARLDVWTDVYSEGHRLVIGETLTPDAAAYRRELEANGQSISDHELLRHYGPFPEKVWARAELARRTRSLTWWYLLTLLALASAVVTVSQAAFCATRRSR